MKKLLAIFFLIPLIGLSQTTERKTLWQEWAVYVQDCNKLVPDTLTEQGKVSVKYVPVLLNGEVYHFKLAPIDTLWTELKCNDYKHSNINGFVLSGDSRYFTTSSITLSDVNSAVFYSRPEQSREYINITRKKICMIKQRKASWQDFWDRWAVENKLIEKN